MEGINLGFIKLKGDKVIWIIIFLLSMISVMAVYSSSNALAFMEKKNTIDYLFRQMQFIIFSLTTLFLFYNIPL